MMARKENRKGEKNNKLRVTDKEFPGSHETSFKTNSK
jgi:hypothetical protein